MISDFGKTKHKEEPNENGYWFELITVRNLTKKDLVELLLKEANKIAILNASIKHRKTTRLSNKAYMFRLIQISIPKS